MTVIGGILEEKTIGLSIGTSGTFNNTELVEGNIQLQSIDGIYEVEGTWTSNTIDMQDNFDSYGKLFATDVIEGDSTITIQTRTSVDGITFDPWISVDVDGTIQSVKRRYIAVRILFHAGYANVDSTITALQLVASNPYVINNDNESISPKRDLKLDMNIDNTWTESGKLTRVLINRDEYLRIDKISIEREVN